MNRHLGIFILIVVILVSSGISIAQEGPGTIQIAQWASKADASSQYTDDSWSAEKATGEPDVLECGDNANAWASEGVTGEEMLVLLYEQAVHPTQINIYQSYKPGAITRVELLVSIDGDTIPIRNSADPGTACPGVFSLDLPGGLPEVIGVVLYFDMSIIGDWNEIDAVELVGTTTGEPADTMPSSIQMNEYPQYAVTSNSGQGSAPNTTSSSSATSSGPSKNDRPSNDYGGAWGTTVTCNDGTTIENGIEMTIIQQRSGSQYRVTVLGIGDFDPVLAVADSSGNALCNDDDIDAASYSANLPTTGQIQASTRSSQILFNNVSSAAFENISVIIGGYGGMGGEFIVIVEGMISSDADGAGDPFSLYVPPALLESGVDPTAYMIAVTTNFDPMLHLIDSNYNTVRDDNGVAVVCDDAGNVSLCWGESADLSRSYVSRSNNRQLGGGPFDAMMTVPLEGLWDIYLNYTMTNNNSYGDYIAVFHLGTAQKQP